MSEAVAPSSEIPTPVPAASGPARPRGSGARFVLTALAIGIGLFALFRVPAIQNGVLIPYANAQQSVAQAVAGKGELPVVVSFACTGADVISLCIAAVAAFPVPWRKRLPGLAVGLALITVVNTARIGSLSLVAGDKPTFDLLHLTVWPAILIVVVSLYVFAWMKWAVRDRATLEEAGAAGAESSTSASATLSGSGERATAIRFALWLVPLTLLFVIGSAWYLEAPWLLVATHWTASTAAALMSLFGLEARVVGNHLTTSRGGFVVTATCLASPLVPVYLAAALSFPRGWARRAGWLLAGIPVFFVLGILRLLVLALPRAMVGSYSDAIHSFNQLLFTALLVVAAATLASRADGELPRTGLRRGLMALGAGALSGVVLGIPWMRALRALVLGGLDRHTELVSHRLAETQAAAALLPAFQLGFLVALAIAVVPRERWRSGRTLIVIAITLLAQVATYLVLAELWSHSAIEPHVRDLRAGMVALPLLLALWWSGRSLGGLVAPPTPVEPLAPRG